MNLTADQASVLEVAGHELERIGVAQQALGDDIAGLLGDMLSPPMVRRLQAFDELRQRIMLLAAVMRTVAETPSSQLGEAVMQGLTLEDMRRDFAAALGIVTAASDGGADIELF